MAALALAGVLVAGCGRGAAPGAPAGLTVTGAISFPISSVQAQQPCGATGGAYRVELDFTHDGRQWAVSVELLEYQGAGRYGAPPGRVSIRTLGTGSGTPVFFAGTGGTVVVNADGVSGTVDEELSGQPGSAHLSGSWSCH